MKAVRILAFLPDRRSPLPRAGELVLPLCPCLARCLVCKSRSGKFLELKVWLLPSESPPSDWGKGHIHEGFTRSLEPSAWVFYRLILGSAQVGKSGVEVSVLKEFFF